EELLAARAGKLACGAFRGQAVLRHDIGDRAQVDRRAAALRAAIEGRVNEPVLEITSRAVHKDRRVPELEPDGAAPVRTGEIHQLTRWSFLSGSAARRNVSIFLGNERRICRRPGAGTAQQLLPGTVAGALPPTIRWA